MARLDNNSLFEKIKLNYTCSTSCESSQIYAIPQNLFAPAIATVSRAVASRPTHPILGNIKLVADEDSQTLTLTGFDLEYRDRNAIACSNHVIGGAITLPSKLLGDIVSLLPDEDITLTIATVGEISQVTLACGSGKYQINSLPVTEFPDLPEIDSDEAFSISVATLRDGLLATMIAVSADETKRILTGISVTSREGLVGVRGYGWTSLVCAKDIG
jgi:DNA polymerase III subunit beta